MWHPVQLCSRAGGHLVKLRIYRTPEGWYQASLRQALCQPLLLHCSQATRRHQPPCAKKRVRRMQSELSQSLDNSRRVCYTSPSIMLQLRNGHILTLLLTGAVEKSMYKQANSCSYAVFSIYTSTENYLEEYLSSSSENKIIWNSQVKPISKSRSNFPNIESSFQLLIPLTLCFSCNNNEEIECVTAVIIQHCWPWHAWNKQDMLSSCRSYMLHLGHRDLQRRKKCLYESSVRLACLTWLNTGNKAGDRGRNLAWQSKPAWVGLANQLSFTYFMELFGGKLCPRRVCNACVLTFLKDSAAFQVLYLLTVYEKLSWGQPLIAF